LLRIRRVFDDILQVNREAIRQAQEIWKQQFDAVSESEVAALAEKLRNPMEQRFRRILFVAENVAGDVRGFAILMHAPEERFCFLEYIASAPGRTGAGIGGALYQRLRDEALQLGCLGIFFECPPDSPTACPEPDLRRQNVRRLKFYEEFGARPLVGNLYDTPVSSNDTHAPLLVFDDLGQGKPLRSRDAQRVVRAILERKYGTLCPPDYIERVVHSFQEDPVRLREPLYAKPERTPPAAAPSLPLEGTIALAVNDQHSIHHVRDRGYVESPVRVRSILRVLEKTHLFQRLPARAYPEQRIKAVHDTGFVDYLKRVCANIPPEKSVYPYVFPIRNAARPPVELAVRAGYYCIDTFTPLNPKAYQAARSAVDCALRAAEALLEGYRMAYALVRPPGHHAERRAFGGFCYFNSAAIAAHFLSPHGRVAMLDLDYHHGNGQQNIFYDRRDVLTLSIHGDPSFAYPYFAGFKDETGKNEGEGFNVNFPLPEQVDGPRYRKTLEKTLQRVADFAPAFLVVPLGLDTAKGDPTGTWTLSAADFQENGRLLGSLNLPTLVVQEGGYRTRTLGTNARWFFQGLAEAQRRERSR
jgi:acetoin utilization deacetylase AcuC-like enzyme/GNAT superfamily N-acetyltransferase